MLMKSLGTNTQHRGHRASGFSLIEMVTVLGISIVISVISVMSLVPMLNYQHVVNAYNTSMAAMRQARDNAVSQRTSYSVTFSQTTSAPIQATIVIAPTLSGFRGDQSTVTYQFPSDVFFVQPPTGTAAPDGYGSGASAIDFGYTAASSAGGASTIYFCPDGSSQTTNSCSGAGNWDGGAVYLGRTGDPTSERAITLYGGTGRIHGWRLYSIGGGNYQWTRQ
jgi:type II secretory pathway pseudopilin PulG